MEKNNTTIRPVEKKDSKRIWEIRNHPISRKHSLNSEIITFESHDLWFEKKYFSEQDNYCFVMLNDKDLVIGYCRLDFDDGKDNYIISIALDPEFRGKGMGSRLLREALAKSNLSKEIFAEIKKDNIPSVTLFKKCGFIKKDEDNKNYYFVFKNTTEHIQKTIFITIARSFIIRNILRSGTLELLKKSGWRVVIFFEVNEISARLREEFADECVIMHSERTNASRMHRLFLRFRKYLLATSTTKILIDFRQGNKDRQKFRKGFLPKKSSFVAQAQKLYMEMLSRIPFIKFIYRFIEENIFTEKNYNIQQYFKKYKPDIIFGTSVVSSLDIAFMKEAKRRHINTIAMPKTWDNIMNGYFRFIPDYFLVHNTLAKDLSYKNQHIEKDKIFVIGMPQFDWYCKQEIIKDRTKHWNSKGLDPNKKIIFFGSAGIWAAHDHVIAELIYKWIEKGELVTPCQLFLRQHFSNVQDDVFKELRGKKEVAIDDYKIANAFSDNWDPTVKDTIDFTNSVAHCDIMINIGSTLSLDASCVDRPVVNPAFGCSFQGGEDVTFPYQYGADHYQWVLSENATALSFNSDQLKTHINEYLLHPEKQRTERANLIKKLCYKVDGKSSQRIVDKINSIQKGI